MLWEYFMIFSPFRHSDVPSPFVEKHFLSPPNCTGAFLKNEMKNTYGYISGLFKATISNLNLKIIKFRRILW